MTERLQAGAALRIAIVGAESTGKTTLADALVPRLAALSGLRVAWVPELLRGWCAERQRTPHQDEQAAIASDQHAQIEAAAADHDIVLCDTTALMTAVYSHIVFGDSSLDAAAIELHRSMALTLLMALDLPWVADGLQRDGPHVREPVDTLLREMLLANHLPWAGVRGEGLARVEAAIDAVLPLLRGRVANAAGTGLFTRLAARDAADAADAARPWRCEHCDDPACERLTHRA